ncbi:MAG: enoyl-CoA hydratase/isomerase family protein [Calditrichae bacterium]|nr:enoyl-CoA hydratase/isomerase family protein [Calditrichia bacterium]
MSDTGRVTKEIRDGIGTITFFHPKKNSLPGALLKEITAAVTDIGENPAVRVMVLRSEGDGPFCAGASFDELLSIQTFAQGKEFFMGFARLILAMKKCPKFIIARIQGKAVGGGVGVTAAADYALATERSAVKLSELALGIGPFVVGPAVERKLGSGPFSAMSIDADWRDAAWAKRHGLYVDIYPDIPALDAAVAAMAAKLAGCSPEAMALLKAACWKGSEEWDQLLESRAEMSGKLVLSAFTAKAIAAFKQQ